MHAPSPADTPPASWPTVRPASCLQSFAYASPTSSAPSSSTGPPASMQTIASQAIPQETPPLPLGCATAAAVRSTTNCGPRSGPQIGGSCCEQRVCFFEVLGVEAFGERAVDGCEQLARLAPAALLAPQPGEARGGA